MTSSLFHPAPASRPRRSNRRLLLLSLVVVFALVAGGIAAFSLLVDEALDEEVKRDRTCCWDKHATVASVARRIGIRIPTSAIDRRAGVKENDRQTVAVIAFTVPTRLAESYLARLVPEDERMVAPTWPDGSAPPEPDSTFRHLGLPEPSTVGPHSGVRTVNLCPDAAGKEAVHLKHCVDVYRLAVNGTADRTRLYFRSVVAGQ